MRLRESSSTTLDHDVDAWVQYGAVRSLVEMAALDLSIVRERVLKGLVDRQGRISSNRKLRDEFVRAKEGLAKIELQRDGVSLRSWCYQPIWSRVRFLKISITGQEQCISSDWIKSLREKTQRIRCGRMVKFERATYGLVVDYVDDRFMNLAYVAEWSKDRSTKVGCVVIGPDREVRSMGYNGFPRGINDEIERRHARPDKYTEHAERNAIYNAARVGVP